MRTASPARSATSSCESFSTAIDPDEPSPTRAAPLSPTPPTPQSVTSSGGSSDTLSAALTEVDPRKRRAPAHRRNMSARELRWRKRRKRAVVKIQAAVRGAIVRRRVALLRALRASDERGARRAPPPRRGEGVDFLCSACGAPQSLNARQFGALRRIGLHRPTLCRDCYRARSGYAPKLHPLKCTACAREWLATTGVMKMIQAISRRRPALCPPCFDWSRRGCAEAMATVLQRSVRRRRVRRMWCALAAHGRDLRERRVAIEVRGVVTMLVDDVIVNAARERREFEQVVARMRKEAVRVERRRQLRARGLNVEATTFVMRPAPSPGYHVFEQWWPELGS